MQEPNVFQFQQSALAWRLVRIVVAVFVCVVVLDLLSQNQRPSTEELYWGIFAVLLLIVTRRLQVLGIQTIKIQIFADHLLVEVDAKEIAVSFSEIVNIRKSILRSSGTFTMYTKNGEKISVAGTMNGSDKILDAVNSGNPDLLTRKEYENLLRSIVLANHRQTRFKENKSLITAAAFGIPCIALSLAGFKPDSFFAVVSCFLICAIFFGIAAMIVVNSLINRRYKLNSIKKNRLRNLDYEHQIIWRIYSVYLSIIIASYAVFFFSF